MSATDSTSTRVLVIGGWGRCGSTLLDMMLGPAGRLRAPPASSASCGCAGAPRTDPAAAGRPSAGCPFWSEVGGRRSAGGPGWTSTGCSGCATAAIGPGPSPACWPAPGRRTCDNDLAALPRRAVAARRRRRVRGRGAGRRRLVEAAEPHAPAAAGRRRGRPAAAPGPRQSRGSALGGKHVVKTVSHGDPTLLPRARSRDRGTALRPLQRGAPRTGSARAPAGPPVAPGALRGPRPRPVTAGSRGRAPRRRPGTAPTCPSWRRRRAGSPRTTSWTATPCGSRTGRLPLHLDAAWRRRLGAGDRRVVTAAHPAPARALRLPRHPGARSRQRRRDGGTAATAATTATTVLGRARLSTSDRR